MFGSGGAFLVLTAVALWVAFDAARLHAWRRCCVAVATALALATLAGGFLAGGVLHPTFNFRNNQGFSTDWSCLNLGRGAALACGRDSAPRPVDTPPQQMRPQTPR